MSRVALVTGASSGLGRGLALALAKEGWRVGLMARRAEELEAAAREIERAGSVALVLPTDVRNPQEVREGVRSLEERFGPLDLLVANAGISRRMGPGSFDAEVVRQVLEVNYLGMVYSVEAALPGMLERGSGHLVGVSSIAGFRGLPRSFAYSASKAAMTALLEGLRVDLQGTGVAVTVIHPGYVRTPMTSEGSHRRPFMMELDPAVARMMRSIQRRDRHLTFPLPTAWAMRFVRLLPPGLYDRIAGIALQLGSRSPGPLGPEPPRG